MTRVIFILAIGLLISCSPRVTYISEIDPEYYRIDSRQGAESEAITDLIAPYKTKLDVSMNKVIGKVEKDMAKSKPNSPLNNWVADVILDEAREQYGEVDFAVQNYGGMRIPSLTAGDITIGKVYELMPFDNLITVLKAKGEIVQMLLDRIADYGGWPVSRNTSFTINDGTAVDIIINGSPFHPDKVYTFALPDYIANGGDNCFFLSEAERTDLKLLIRDAIIHHIETHDKMVRYNDENRIQIR